MDDSRSTVTIRDVAKTAGVSVSTVSRVLNGKDDVSSATQVKVRKVIDELGYASSLAASSMRSRKSNVLGLVMIDLGDPFSMEIVRGVGTAIRDYDYDLIVYSSGRNALEAESSWERKSLARLNGTITDGLIIVTPTTELATQSPLVIIDPCDESSVHPTVQSTNYEGALSVMDYLTGLGHQRIGFIGGREELLSARERRSGYEDGLRVANFPIDETLIQPGNYSQGAGYQGARHLLSLDNRPTAIFAANDQAAVGVFEAAKEFNVRIPDQLSVIGFDNITDVEKLNPPLTTVDQSVAEVGKIATRLLVDILAGKEPEQLNHRVDTTLVIRESCIAVPV